MFKRISLTSVPSTGISSASRVSILGATFLALVVLFLNFNVASARQLGNAEQVTVAPISSNNAPSNGQIGLLKAELLITDDPNKLLTLWDSPDEHVQLNTIEQTAHDKKAVAFVIIDGCAPDKNGKCSVTVSYKTIFPSGEMHTLSITENLLKKIKAPIGPVLSSPHHFWFDAKDPERSYTMIARIVDLNSGAELLLGKKIQRVVEK